MSPNLSDIRKFETRIFHTRNVMGRLLSFSRKILNARYAALVFGTDRSMEYYLPPGKWDRAILDKFRGRGVKGLVFRLMGRQIVSFKKISPVLLYRTNDLGEKIPTHGAISYTLRLHGDFYKKGVKILVIDNVFPNDPEEQEESKVPVVSYDGKRFARLADVSINLDIINQFKSDNFIAAYIPDYGAIVFDNIDPGLISRSNGKFTNEAKLKARLDQLISAIEIASLAHLGQAKGRAGTLLIRRKEQRLRKAAAGLKESAEKLRRLKKSIRAVGAVTPAQLNMEPVSIPDGVYAFMDMVKSVGVRESFSPRDYFSILDFCHEIAANNAARFGCRVDNFIGDGVFFQNVSVFDDPQVNRPGIGERIMLMTCVLASVFKEIHSLKQGYHPMDREKKVSALIRENGAKLNFRAGMAHGIAMIGPLGSKKRRIVTAIGTAVDLASRLESCGKAGGIHTNNATIKILEDAVISRDTLILNQAVSRNEKTPLARGEYIPFFDFFRGCFTPGADPVQLREGISYKEFSREKTYFIDCVSRPQRPGSSTGVCPGI